jgi:predicted signal transduction protein with EAL and GGDEF domain
VVLLEDVPGVAVAVAAARRICAAAGQPMVLPDGYEIVASVSVGIALTEPGKTADDVLRNADVAMYEPRPRAGVASTGGQVAELKMLGCHVGQGFYFSQPLRAGEFDELLTRHFARTAELAEGQPA